MSGHPNRTRAIVEFDEFLERRIANASVEWIDAELKARNLDYESSLQNIRAAIAAGNVEPATQQPPETSSWSRVAAALLVGAFLLLMAGDRKTVESARFPLFEHPADFNLRILFSGLIALVPTTDDKALDVVLLHVPDHGAGPRPHHKPLLLARAGGCEPACPPPDPRVSQWLFTDLMPERATDALADAVEGGGAWVLSGTDLSLVATRASEHEDLNWSTGVTDESLAASSPPSGVMVARLRLRSRTTFTYSVVRVQGQSTPVYAQGVPSWMAVDIRLPGNGVEIVERDAIRRTTRSTTLRSRDGRVELAVVSLPRMVPAMARPEESPLPGEHFQRLYDLKERPP